MQELFDRGVLPDDFVRASIPIARYFEVVGNFSQAARDISLPLETRYVHALRLSHLLVSLLPRHPDMQRLPRWAQRAKENAKLAVDLAEKLAAEIKLERMAQQLGFVTIAKPTVNSVPAAAADVSSSSSSFSSSSASAAAAAASVSSSSSISYSASPSVATKPQEPAVQQFTRVAGNLFESFARCASVNTNRNVETCGMLCGTRSSSGLVITHVLVPKQTGTSDYCAATDEEGLLDAQLRLDLICVGWIHTHPQHKCFLSSIDLHTTVSYQALLPDALAVVIAPTDAKLPVGIFRLTDQGLKLVLQCPLRGFHPHDESRGALYGLAQDIRFDSTLAPSIVDLRSVNNKI